ncbi:MAG: hypothetical protein QOH70_1965 [Blastocatellia bacterium]|jgi:uncharacterized protein (TIGR00725 family)|nr:hypothetical protein [Blastocatellia bacterium]
MTILNDEKQWIAVLGGAGQYSEDQIIAGYTVGRECARAGKNIVTGATTGIPYAAALGAKEEGALVIGVSPAASASEHVLKYQRPVDSHDFIVYAGNGLAGRSAVLLQSVCGAIFVGGEFGTLFEFSAACFCDISVLGILRGVGGVSDHLPDILSYMKTRLDGRLIFDDDPVRLARRVCAEAGNRYSTQSSQLPMEDIGADVRQIIHRFIEEENGATCVKQSANTTIGASSIMSLQ